MLFNSHVFLLVFLPTTALFFYGLRGYGYPRAATALLVLASLFFYAWWNPVYLWLILVSVAVNFRVGVGLARMRESRGKSLLLTLGVAANLGLLAYYKYAGFLLDNLNALVGSQFSLGEIILPLAISFFTFQQIAYLVDVRRGEAAESDWLHYALFVTFFPQLIAGPIVHHGEMMPQFSDRRALAKISSNISLGIALLAIGLFKKAVIADGIAELSTPIFEATESGALPTTQQAWGAALAYTFQLYFDFSGYADMALGAARIFGIRLPLNFRSPYKSTGILDFWRRWHITLGRVVESYLFQPFSLAMTRFTARRRLGSKSGFTLSLALPLMVTYLAVGIWHGAGWTFVVFGFMHAVFAIINHSYREWKRRERRMRRRSGLPPRQEGAALRVFFRLITFVAVVFSLVVFRANDLATATTIIREMLLIPSPSAGPGSLVALGEPVAGDVALLSLLAMIVFFAPNTQQILGRYDPAIDIRAEDATPSRWSFLEWRMQGRWAVITAIVAVLGLVQLNQASEFLYFNF